MTRSRATRWRKRAIALTIGATTAIAAVVVVQCVAMEAIRGTPTATLQCTNAMADSACAGSLDEMLVDSSAIGERRERRVAPHHEAGTGELHAEYGESWAERKLVTFVISGRDVLTRAEFDTDYGNFGGEIDVDNSRVHLHDETLCFDLTLERLDGSDIRERWQGQVALR